MAEFCHYDQDTISTRSLDKAGCLNASVGETVTNQLKKIAISSTEGSFLCTFLSSQTLVGAKRAPPLPQMPSLRNSVDYREPVE